MDNNSSQLIQLNIITGTVDQDIAYNNSRCLRMVKLNNHYFSTGIFEEGMFGIWNDSDFMTFVVDYPEDKMDNNSFSRMAMRQNRLVGIIFVS